MLDPENLKTANQKLHVLRKSRLTKILRKAMANHLRNQNFSLNKGIILGVKKAMPLCSYRLAGLIDGVFTEER